MTAEQLELVAFALATVLYFVAWAGFLVGWRSDNERQTNIAHYVLVSGFVCHAVLVCVRYYRSEDLPVMTAFEFVTAFSFVVIGVFLAFSLATRNRTLGVFLLPVSIVLHLYAIPMSKELQPEIMIFKGAMLKIHVVTVLIGYAFWVITFSASVCYLYLERSGGDRPYLWDQTAYKAAFIAFCFHTAAIVTGALWADQVLGVLWSWDMKETWSFITWLVFLCYLHARYNRDWDGTRAAYLAIGGFAALVFTYVGVDYFLPQLHSMGGS